MSTPQMKDIITTLIETLNIIFNSKMKGYPVVIKKGLEDTMITLLSAIYIPLFLVGLFILGLLLYYKNISSTAFILGLIVILCFIILTFIITKIILSSILNRLDREIKLLDNIKLEPKDVIK